MRPVDRLESALFAAVFMGAGVFHFINPEFYSGKLPEGVPHRLAVVLIGGAFEFVCGLAVLRSRLRRLGAAGIALLLTAVIPLNLFHAGSLADNARWLAVLRTASLACLWLWAVRLSWMGSRYDVPEQ